MALPKEPRQQMITMMYLVLTALLALNVSAEILKAFKVVNDSLEKTRDVIVDKNKLMMTSFESKMQEEADKTRPFYEAAQQAQSVSTELGDFIAKIKGDLIDEGGNGNGEVDEGDFSDDGQLAGAKNLDISSRIMINDGVASEFRKKIETARKELLDKIKQGMMVSMDGEVDQSVLDNFEDTFPLEFPKNPEPVPGEPEKSWEASLFGDIPLAAAVTLLSKFEADVKTSESEVVNYLLNSISAADYKFDNLKATVLAKSGYVMQGSEYEAEIFVTAFSSTSDPKVIIGDVDSLGNPLSGDTTMVKVENGIAKYKVPATSVGEKEYKGVILMKKPSGSGFDPYPFNSSYMVMQPQAVVSPLKMNVLYIGVENPLGISASGVTADKIVASMPGGTLKPGDKKGEYMARVTKPGDIKVNVSYKDAEGNTKNLGTQDFRVKRVPDPIAKIAGQSGGNIKTGTFKAQRGIMAVLENFDFEFRFQIQSFELTYAAKRQDLVMSKTTGPLFDQKMLGWMSRAKPGDMFYFDNIKAKGDDGTTRKLPSIAFKLL